jgi:hypothetical protein
LIFPSKVSTAPQPSRKASVVIDCLHFHDQLLSFDCVYYLTPILAVTHINNMGGIKSDDLNSLSKDIWKLVL